MVDRSALRDVRIAVDVGGTFTDLVMVRDATGEVHVTKTRTTPADPSLGLITGIRKLLSTGRVDPQEVAVLLFASTVATNAVLQLSGARIGLMVTAGFRDILEIGRANIPGRLTNESTYRRPERLVPLERVREVDERCLPDGVVLRPLEEAGARRAIRELLDQGVESIAISLLHSYANPSHERRIRELIAEESPGMLVSLSSDVLPEYREYERTMTTVLNSYVMPVMDRAIRGVRERLASAGLSPSLRVVRSDGGVMSAEATVQRPVNTVLSGPAAGVYGAAHVARMAGYGNAISLDMGGTSTDVALATGGAGRIRADAKIGEYPVKIPIMDVATIGAGGGSIAYLAADGALHVGPRSAGADPGPVCYAQGGTEVTVTDANLVLGRLPPYLVGGEIRLDAEEARAAMEALARRVGMDPVALAAGIVTIADEKMLGALRVVSVQRGYDPRDFVLIPFGGAGPVHAGQLCRLLGIPTAVVPPAPGVLSAVGALVADVTCVFGCTWIHPVDRISPEEGERAMVRLAAEAMAWLESEGIAPEDRDLLFTADLRYAGQASEVSVPTSRHLTPDTIDTTLAAFHAEHRRLYGFDWRGQLPVELVALKATGLGRVKKANVLDVPEGMSKGWSTGGGAQGDALIGSRPAFFDGRFVDTPCYLRGLLGVGERVFGPAIVEQLDCTTVVHPGQVATVDEQLNLVLREDSRRQSRLPRVDR